MDVIGYEPYPEYSTGELQRAAQYALRKAIENQDCAAVTAAANAGARINDAFEGKEKALVKAIRTKNVPLVQTVLALGADINGDVHNHPLAEAILVSTEAICLELLKHAPDLTRRYSDMLPLFLTLQLDEPKTAVALALMDKGASRDLPPGRSRLEVWLGRAGRVSFVKSCLARESGALNLSGYAAGASIAGNIETLEYLHAAFPGKTDWQEALHAAIRGDQLTSLKWLLVHGADIDAPYQGNIPLQRAVLSTAPSCLEQLLRHGANPMVEEGISIEAWVQLSMKDSNIRRAMLKFIIGFGVWLDEQLAQAQAEMEGNSALLPASWIDAQGNAAPTLKALAVNGKLAEWFAPSCWQEAGKTPQLAMETYRRLKQMLPPALHPRLEEIDMTWAASSPQDRWQTSVRTSTDHLKGRETR